MPDTTDLAYVDAMIEKEWGRSISELDAQAIHRPAEDPLLRAAMRIRAGVATVDCEIQVRLERLQALTSPSASTPAFFDLERITEAAVKHQVARAESRTALQAVSFIIDARKTMQKPDGEPARQRAKAAVARSEHAPRALGLPPDLSAAPARTAPVTAAARPLR